MRQVDLGLTPSHLDLPGAPDIVKQLDAYLDAKGVRRLFVELGEMLLQSTPANPVWLCEGSPCCIPCVWHPRGVTGCPWGCG